MVHPAHRPKATRDQRMALEARTYYGMRMTRSIAMVMVLLLGTVFARGAEVRIPAAKAQCGSLARVAFSVEAQGPVANLQFELAVDGAELVGVHQAPATKKWIIRRVDEEGHTSILMRGGPVEASETLGQILLRIPPVEDGGVAVHLSNIRAFGDGFGEVVPGIAASVTIDCASPPLVFRPLAGSQGGWGSRDGVAGRALMKYPASIVADGEGNIFVADSGNHAIRRIDARGETITLAGRLGVSGHADGRGPDALFQAPRGIALAPDGSLVVADTGTQTIRRVSSSGEVTTIAGMPGDFGTADGAGASARFCFPSAVAVEADGSIVVADTGYLHEPIYGGEGCGHTIRRIDTRGQVSTFAGKAGGGVGVSDGSGSAARFSNPSGIVVDPSGTTWVSDTGFTYGRSYTGRTIRRISPEGLVTTVAGRPDAPYLGGSVDGVGRDAHFAYPSQIALEARGTLVVADGASIRRVTAGGVVTTVGTIPGATRGVAVEADGSILASDLYGAVWKLDPPAPPVLVAGSRPGNSYTTPPDDPPSFGEAVGVAVDGAGNAYVAGLQRIARVTPDGRVSVVASADGARPFMKLWAVAVDASGTLWATDVDASCVWRIRPDGTTLRIGHPLGWFGWNDGAATDAIFWWPRAIAVAPDQSVWVADTGNHVLRRITPDGTVSTIVGEHGVNETRDGSITEARFNHPVGIAFGPGGEIWVTESYANTVRLVSPEGQVSTIAGAPSVNGDADGIGPAARFYTLQQVAVDARGRAWVADENGMIRIVERDGTVTTAAGGPGAFADFDATSFRGVDGGLGSGARFMFPMGLAFAPDGRLLVTDSGARSLKVGIPCFEGARCGAPRERPVRR